MWTSMDTGYSSTWFSSLSQVTYLCLVAISMGFVFSVQQTQLRITNSFELGLPVFISIGLLFCTRWSHVLFGTLLFLIPTVTILLRISIYDLQNHTEFSFESMMASVVGSTLALCLLVLCWAIAVHAKQAHLWGIKKWIVSLLLCLFIVNQLFIVPVQW